MTFPVALPPAAAGCRFLSEAALTSAALVLLAGANSAWAQPPATEPTPIPLVHVKSDFSGDDYDSLGILVGINGAKPRLYEFDTGSNQFNMQIGSENAGVSPVPGSKPDIYAYGDGTYGYWVQQVQFDSLSYYDPGNTSRPVATIGGGYTAGRVLDAVYTREYHGFADRKIAAKPVGYSGDDPLYADLDVRNRIRNNEPGETPPFYGIFGAADAIGEEVKTSALGGRTRSGYLISANANLGDKSTSGCAPCLTLNLSPSIRSQFTAMTPWGKMDYDGYRRQFPQSGGNASTEYEGSYRYTISIDVGSKKRAVDFQGSLLFDTGTSQFLFASADNVLKKLNSRGLKVKRDSTESVDFKIFGSGDKLNDLEFDDVELYRLSNEDEGDGIIVGLPFFQSNSILYDLENRSTGYSPYFVTAIDFSTSPGNHGLLHLSKATSGMGSNGWLGLAGTLSGAGDFTVEKDAVVRMTGSNSLTGSTKIADGGFIYLAGPGSISHSAKITVDGVFDISQKGNHLNHWGTASGLNDAEIRDLSGAGEIHIGARRLIVTAANGRFDGAITDYDGEKEGLGGGLILAGGRLTLGGNNEFTGLTEVAAGAELVIAGSLAGDVRVAGKLVVEGEVAGTIHVESGGSLTGSGKAGSILVAQGGSAVRLKTTEID